MTEEEFDILDELYFVTSYDDLKAATDMEDENLKAHLIPMIQKGWVRIYRSVDEESELSKVDLEKEYTSLYYLASKKGLMEHNRR